MQPLCVYFGADRPDYTQMGGPANTGGEANGAVVHPYSHGPACRRSSSELGRCTSGRAASKWAANGTVVCPYSHAPPFGGDVRAQGGTHRTKQNGTKLCMLELPRPHLSVGTSELQVSMHSGPKAEARSERGRGDATDVVIVRLLQDKHWSRYGDIGKLRPGYDFPGAQRGVFIVR